MTRHRDRKAAIAIAAVACATLSSTALAATKHKAFVPLDQFVAGVRSASFLESLKGAEVKVRDATAFDEMRQSILDRYDGVTVTHSFVQGGQYYDCVPVDQQPAVRNYHLTHIEAAPPQALAGKPVIAEGNIRPATMIDADKPNDVYGNRIGCEANTVPLLRTTLETMLRFPALKDYYTKVPGGAVQAAQDEMSGVVHPNVTSHKYSYTYQNVNNWGGNANLNVWAPYVNTGAGEIFSLSQEWYVGGSGSGLQTEEVGWVVYPAMFGNDEHPHFFIFSTPDGYASGCWNNSCGDFVQVASSGLLGASLSPISTSGGTQYEISAEYYWYAGNWWLQEQGTWVGYYPGSKYKGGQNTRYAQTIEFGTESVGSTVWGPEGSGNWSSSGWAYAAYQRNLWYIANTASYASYWDSLTAAIPSPSCYSISGPYTSTSSGWNVYFYEGGPGGYGC